MSDVYRDLAEKLLMPRSPLLPRIWRHVCSPEEATLVNALPATLDDLAERFATPSAALASRLRDLFHRGVIFEQTLDGITSYRMPRHIMQFHAASILWDQAPDELIALWRDFMDTEYPDHLALLVEADLPPFMRVIPAAPIRKTHGMILPTHEARQLVNQARDLAVTTCACRKLMQRCDHPLEVCLQLDNGARYNLKRGTGRRIDRAEAGEILDLSADHGLVHLAENRPGSSSIICNCCTCCCKMFHHPGRPAIRSVVDPSPWRPYPLSSTCTGCGVCIDLCPTHAISLDVPVTIDHDRCLGCGLCARACPEQAILLSED